MFKIQYQIERNDLVKLFIGNVIKIKLIKPTYIGFAWKAGTLFGFLTIMALIGMKSPQGFLYFVLIELIIITIILVASFISYMRKNRFLLGEKQFEVKLTSSKLVVSHENEILVELYPEDINWVEEVKDGVMIKIDKQGKFAIPRRFISTKQVGDLIKFSRRKTG